MDLLLFIEGMHHPAFDANNAQSWRQTLTCAAVTSCSDAAQAAAKGLKQAKGNELKAIVGKLADAESIIALKVRFCYGWLEVLLQLAKTTREFHSRRLL